MSWSTTFALLVAILNFFKPKPKLLAPQPTNEDIQDITAAEQAARDATRADNGDGVRKPREFDRPGE